MSGYIGTQPVPQATQTRDSFTATSGQTSFATGGYTPNFLDVYLNGVKLAAADYTATNGSDVVLASGAATGDILEVVAYTTFEISGVTGLTPSIDDNGNATAITIDSNENVLVGKTSGSSNVAGHRMNPRGDIESTRSGGLVSYFNRQSSDGDISVFAKDGTNVGSIGSYSGNAIYVMAPANGGSGLLFSNNAAPIYPIQNVSGTATLSDGHSDIGAAVHRFKDLYLSGGVYLGGTGSANKLDDYEEGGWTPGAKGASSSNVATVASATAGSYVKIGNQVTVNFIVVISSLGSATGPLQITGLPFTVAAPLVSTGIQANGTAGYWAGFATSINNLVFTAEGNTNLMYAYGTTNGTQTSLSNITIAQMGTAALRGTITYRST